jgi:hypothetical protein
MDLNPRTLQVMFAERIQANFLNLLYFPSSSRIKPI